MLYYLIAGEASGDLHGSNLMREIVALDPSARFRFWGGDKMAKYGGEPVKHINELAFMGFKEVLLNIRAIFKNLSLCKKELREYKPDVLVLIDYPGFNMRIAKFAKKIGIKVTYYIAPQAWAWNQSRVKALKRDVDQLLVILPFEKEFFSRHGINTTFVGHPLLDALQMHEIISKSNFPISGSENNPLIALLPGSRAQEIEAALPVMARVADKFPQCRFVIAGLSLHDNGFYEQILEKCNNKANIEVVFDQTYSLLSHSTAAIVTSGTATLETALLNIPQVVCYRIGGISYQIAKRLIKIKYISLVNLVANRQVVRELIQKDFNEETLATELHNLINNRQYRNKMLEEYQNVKNLIGGPGASKRAAEEVVTMAAIVNG